MKVSGATQLISCDEDSLALRPLKGQDCQDGLLLVNGANLRFTEVELNVKNCL